MGAGPALRAKMRTRQIFLFITAAVTSGEESTCKNATPTPAMDVFVDPVRNGTYVQWYSLLLPGMEEDAVGVYLCAPSESTRMVVLRGACSSNQTVLAPAYPVKQIKYSQFCAQADYFRMLMGRPWSVAEPMYARVDNPSGDRFTFIYGQYDVYLRGTDTRLYFCNSSSQMLTSGLCVDFFFVRFPDALSISSTKSITKPATICPSAQPRATLSHRLPFSLCSIRSLYALRWAGPLWARMQTAISG